MKMDLNQIKKNIASDWANFQTCFRQATLSEVSLINDVNSHILKRSGKQLRPLLVMLSSRICGKTNENVYAAATAVEMLHTASLLHDDVVDNADQRRGEASVKANWQSKVAVLTGDYWLSKAAQLIVDCKKDKMFSLFTTCLMNLSEGELFQLQKTASLDNSEQDYLTIIEKKTAILLATCTALGAIATDASPEIEQRMYEIGYNMGMAFQIKDDIFDYETRNHTGKSVGNDIRERKITLPLLYSLKQASKEEQPEVMQWIKNVTEKPENVSRIIKFVHKNNGIVYTIEKMKSYSQKAVNILLTFPDTTDRQAMISLAEYMSTRKK